MGCPLLFRIFVPPVTTVRMAEWSKAPDSRFKPCSLDRGRRMGILVLVWGRGFKSHFWQIIFPFLFYFMLIQTLLTLTGVWRYSSVVEHPAAVRQVLGSTPSVSYHFFLLPPPSFFPFILHRKKLRAKRGFEPRTSCTQSRNHTPRPFGHHVKSSSTTWFKITEELN